MLKIIDINKQYTAASVEEVADILRTRFDTNSNSFNLSHDDDEYPLLSILVKDELATLSYFARDNEPGWVPTGSATGSKAETTLFHISRYPADDLQVQNDAVVSFATALNAAAEFFNSKELPTSINWLEL